jgi:hypothetical protein
MKFVIFCNFFRIFWTPNGQKRLVATASTRGPIRSRHVDQSNRAMSLSPALSPRQCLASLSPASRPGGRSSAGERAIARRRPLARLSPARGRQRPLLARAAARTATSLSIGNPSSSIPPHHHHDQSTSEHELRAIAVRKRGCHCSGKIHLHRRSEQVVRTRSVMDCGGGIRGCSGEDQPLGRHQLLTALQPPPQIRRARWPVDLSS